MKKSTGCPAVSAVKKTVITLSILFLMSAVSPRAFSQDKGSVETLRQLGDAFSQIAEKASPAVVWITAEKTVARPSSPFDFPDNPFDDEFFRRFFRGQNPPQLRQQQPKMKQTDLGSGFIVSADGYIMTNNHVVAGADKLKVKLLNNKEYDGKLVGTDPETEVAVIKIDANDLPFLELGDSDKIKVGEWVLAIGNPFGQANTVTAGIISAKNRNIGMSAYENYIQTDAAINPGNSGGPLINIDGQVIGINTAIISRSGGNLGIGLAIPVNMAKSVYDELVKGGKVVRGFLGISYSEVTPELAKALGLEENTKGVVISQIIKDSAAEKAGLKINDVIVEFNGKPVEKVEDFRYGVAALKPGTKVDMVIMREGKKETISVELGERPSKEQLAGEAAGAVDKLGFTVQDLTDELAQRFGYTGMKGVIVNNVDSDSEAADKGISSGMLIMEVNQKPVANVKEFNNAVTKAASKGSVLLLLTDGQKNWFVVLNLKQK